MVILMINLEQFKEYLNQRRLRSVSVDSYIRDTEQFCDYMKSTGVASMGCVTEQEIRQYCAYMMKRGLAPVSMQRKLASIRRLFDYLCGTGQAQFNPVCDTQVRRHKTVRARVLTDEQLCSLLAMPDTHSPGGMRDKAMFALICSTGIKVSELISLRVPDLHIAEKCLSVNREKRSVLLQLDEDVCLCLNAYLASRGELCPKDNDTLFLNVYGKKITRQGVWKTLKKYADNAGIEGVTLETIRRSFARRYLDSGKDIRGLQCILGHSDISITRAYMKK